MNWNTHVAQAHMAEAKGAKQLVICQTSREVNFLSNWDIREVLKILKIKVEEEEAMRETWVHDQTKMTMEDIMKKPNLLKSAATKHRALEGEV